MWKHVEKFRSTNGLDVGFVPGKEEERQMFQQMQAMAQKQVLMMFYRYQSTGHSAGFYLSI